MLNIVSGVCLLLWGLRGVRQGMTRAFGADLHRVVSASTNNRVKAFLAGIGVTALLQSSTATALIIASFCGRGMMSVAAGLAVILGADVGTTLVAQILSFDLSWLAPMLLIVGYTVFSLYSHKGRLEHIGKLLVGLALMLFALMWIRESSGPMKESETLKIVLQSLDNDAIFAVMIAAVLTWLAHSSLAIVLLLTSLVVSGVLPVEVGMDMVLGANLGGVIPPLVATLKDSRESARVPVGNLIMRLAGVVLILPFVDVIQALVAQFGGPPERMLVNFHMVFNVALALAFLPFTGRIAALCTTLIPARVNEEDPSQPRYLDYKQLDTPSVALSAVMRETLRMGEIVEGMLEDTLKALRDYDETLVTTVKQQDDVLDNIYKAVKMYIARLSQTALDPDEAEKSVRLLSFATNLENVGDTIDKSLMEMARKKIRTRMHFSHDGWQEIQNIHRMVLQTVKLAQSVFVSGDTKMARKLVEGKEDLRLEEMKATKAHLERIREGVPETIATSSLHLDIIRDLRRIDSYMASVAYPILEDAGQLRASKLKAPQEQ